MQQSDPTLTQWLALAARGERAALDHVFATLYPELRKIARGRLHMQRDDGHLGTTTLVHETFLRLVGAAQLELADRKHFYTYAAKTMRHIIIDFARERAAQRRGGGAARVTLDTDLAGQLAEPEPEASLVRLNDSLLALEAVDANLARLVEMRYFAGYSEAEAAELLGTSERTVRRQWDKARAYLLASLRE
jgi:RNA polymerase sigma factor (TIGR02999 family)